ncbi:MAG: hypothetical protein AAFQ40_09225 [Cyanobacteria bacterium J06623_5]
MEVQDRADILTDQQWQIADAIARELVLGDMDVNELRKAIAYLRTISTKETAGKRFFDYLKTLVRQGNTIGHSKRTLGYYRTLDEVCTKYLSDYQDDAPRMLVFLGWAARLIKYYKEGVPTGEKLTVPAVQSKREAELQAVVADNTFEVGQVLEATITAIRGNKVTYEILGTIRLTEKEPKLLKKSNPSEGHSQEVEIIGLREDGSIRKVRAVQN